jgi:type IV pilus assembly protein PilO
MTFEEFKQLDPKEPGRWPLPVRVGAIVLFFVVASALLVWFGVWNRNKEELARVQNEEVTLRKDFKDKQAKAVNLDLYKPQLADIQRSFGAQLRQLPSSSEMAALLIDISQSGSGVVQHELFQPLDEVAKDFYAEKPIRIRVSGNYHQLAEFVSTLAALPRIVTVHDTNITTRRGGGFDDLQMDLTARTYRYLDEEELAAKSAEQKRNNDRRQR